MRLNEQLERAAEDVLRASHSLREVLWAISAAKSGQPGEHGA